MTRDIPTEIRERHQRRLRRLYAAAGLAIDDDFLTSDVKDELIMAMLDLAPEFVAPDLDDDPDGDLYEQWIRLVHETLGYGPLAPPDPVDDDE